MEARPLIVGTIWNSEPAIPSFFQLVRHFAHVCVSMRLPFVFMGEKYVSNEVIARFEKVTFAG